MGATVYNFEAFEDSGLSLMGRLLAEDAAAAVQADVSSIAYSVYDLADVSSADSTGTLTVATVIFDTLQTDARWDADSTGYNFRWDVPDTVFTGGDKRYRIEIAFSLAGGSKAHGVWEGTIKGLLRS